MRETQSEEFQKLMAQVAEDAKPESQRLIEEIAKDTPTARAMEALIADFDKPSHKPTRGELEPHFAGLSDAEVEQAAEAIVVARNKIEELGRMIEKGSGTNAA